MNVFCVFGNNVHPPILVIRANLLIVPFKFYNLTHFLSFKNIISGERNNNLTYDDKDEFTNLSLCFCRVLYIFGSCNQVIRV